LLNIQGFALSTVDTEAPAEKAADPARTVVFDARTDQTGNFIYSVDLRCFHL
jgi:hypothetical protein